MAEEKMADQESVEEETVEETVEKEENEEEKEEITVEEQLKALEEEVNTWKTDYYKVFADMENLKKRLQNEHANAMKFMMQSFIEQLLPVVDNFERGLDALSEEEKEGAFAQGFIKIYQQMITVLEEIGVKPMDAVGKEFNPDFHNAVMHEENEEMGENLVSEEFQKGYMYKDGVLRHSMVKVVN